MPFPSSLETHAVGEESKLHQPHRGYLVGVGGRAYDVLAVSEMSPKPFEVSVMFPDSCDSHSPPGPKEACLGKRQILTYRSTIAIILEGMPCNPEIEFYLSSQGSLSKSFQELAKQS